MDLTCTQNIIKKKRLLLKKNNNNNHFMTLYLNLPENSYFFIGTERRFQLVQTFYDTKI